MTRQLTTTKGQHTMTISKPNWSRLFSILNMRRPHGTEDITASRFLAHYNPTIYRDAKGDPMTFSITTDPASTTLFSAHLDTVHRTAGERKVKYDPNTGMVTSPDGTPLGADDGAGVWLLLELIDAGVPGTYIFTVGEECGGIGAKWMAANEAEFLSGFDRAVAFDRRGTSSVITSQYMGQCCSDDFAEALSNELNHWLPDDHAFMLPDDTGVYTDTAEYTELIHECTNISVGYQHEHSAQESLDVTFLAALRDACILVGWDNLPTERDLTLPYNDKMWSYPDTYTSAPCLSTEDDILAMSYRELTKFVEDSDPRDIADMLEELAIEVQWHKKGGK